MQLTVATIQQVTGVTLSEADAKTVTDIFIPAVCQEITNYCNQDFIPAPPPNDESNDTPAPDYPSDLGVAACKRAIELFSSRSQTTSKEVKTEQSGGMKVEYFESEGSGKADDWHAALDKYRIPSL
jgi:hypothetical protein